MNIKLQVHVSTFSFFPPFLLNLLILQECLSFGRTEKLKSNIKQQAWFYYQVLT